MKGNLIRLNSKTVSLSDTVIASSRLLLCVTFLKKDSPILTALSNYVAKNCKTQFTSSNSYGSLSNHHPIPKTAKLQQDTYENNYIDQKQLKNRIYIYIKYSV